MKKRIKFLIALLAILGGILAYSLYFSGNGAVPQKNIVADSGAGADGASPAAGSGEDAEIVAILTQLRTVKLDVDFLKDSSFRSFFDFSVELAPEPVGRSNPFSPF